MIVSRLTFFDPFTDFINLERPKSSKSPADIVADEIPSFNRSDKNLYWALFLLDDSIRRKRKTEEQKV
jgi:hypothetical protein